MAKHVVASDKLINSINQYGRKRLSIDTKLSISLLNQVCCRDRNFSPQTLMEKIVPKLWPNQHVMLTDVWVLQEK